MELGEFEFDRLTFELRFDRAFALWDRAGVLTTSLVAQFPKAEMQEANPGKISIFIRPNAEISLELDKAYVIQHSPQRTAEDVMPVATTLTKAVTTFLEVHSFARIGTRAIYRKDFSSLRAATDGLLSLGAVAVPTGKFFGVEGKPDAINYMYKWDGKATGVTLRFHSQEAKLAFSPAPAHAKDVPEVAKVRQSIIADIDYYSTVPVMHEQFRADEWIKNVIHLINRDMRFFLKGR